MFKTILVGVLAMGTGLTDTGTSSPPADPLRDPVRVVTTLPIYAELVREIGGAEVEVTAIANPNEDAHFVRPGSCRMSTNKSIHIQHATHNAYCVHRIWHVIARIIYN